MKSIKLILSMLLFAIGGQLMAQRDTTIHMESQFEGERKLFLKDANKLSVNPFIKEQMVDMLTIRYSTLPTRKAFLIDPKAISPAKINVEDKLARLYRGYIKLGYGTYGTVPADFYFTDGRSKKGTFGVNYHLLRSSGLSLNDNDTIPDRYSENRVELWGRRFIKKSVLEASVNWERNLNHWYGFDNQTIDGSRILLDSLRQRLNTFGGRASFRTFNRDTADLNYGTSIAIRGTSDLYKGKETNVDWVATASKLVNTELFSGEVGVNYNSFAFVGPDLSKYGYPLLDEEDIRERKFDNAVVRMIPMAQTVWKDLRAKVGMALYIEARGENPGHFYPLAEVSYNLLDGLIVPYAGIRGGVEQNSYLDLYKQNPFIQTFPDLRNKNTKYDMYGGVGGAISSELSFSAGVNYFSYDNFAYFVNDSLYSSDSIPTFFTSQGNKFTIIYDQLKTLNIHGELAYYNGKKWKANIRGDYFQYDEGAEVHAWHQPALKFTVGGQYNLRDKFTVGTQIFYVGSRWAKSLVPVEGVDPEPDGSYHYKLDGFTDINFNFEYRYNKRLSAWVQFNNTLALKYQRWSGYNTQRFVGVMGVTYAF